MATSAIQHSSFTGQTALKPSNDLLRKVGASNGGGRVVMRRTVKSTPQSIWFLHQSSLYFSCSYNFGKSFWLYILKIIKKLPSIAFFNLFNFPLKLQNIQFPLRLVYTLYIPEFDI